MSVREGLIVALPEDLAGEPLWLRVVDGGIIQSGVGANWLSACGLTALPTDCRVMLVPPAALTPLYWVAHPDLPARQGRAAARMTALASGIAAADSLFAADDANDDPAMAHVIAVAARADMQHWLLWAQHHGLDPDLIVPAALLLPAPEAGYARGTLGGGIVLRGADMALSGDLAEAIAGQGAAVTDIAADEVNARAIAALTDPPLDMRQGDFAKRVRRSVDRHALVRIAVGAGCIMLISLLIALIGIARHYGEAGRLDDESLTLARQVLPQESDVVQADAELNARLAARGASGYSFTAPVSGLMTAMQGAPGVAVTALSRDPDGLLRVTLAAARASDINIVLVALQAAGFTITATSSQDPGGRTLADITVRA
ncbi:type II secretion system protein GspL [Sphingobium sp. AN641]|uniref:type II secretion system protein GspL n=1 Tax=Sphingobium sp. AN641 TaxID=3133443 RepID=UPI0030BABCDC